jgi:hypothetical protein
MNFTSHTLHNHPQVENVVIYVLSMPIIRPTFLTIASWLPEMDAKEQQAATKEGQQAATKEEEQQQAATSADEPTTQPSNVEGQQDNEPAPAQEEPAPAQEEAGQSSPNQPVEFTMPPPLPEQSSND